MGKFGLYAGRVALCVPIAALVLTAAALDQIKNAAANVQDSLEHMAESLIELWPKGTTKQ